MEAVGPEEIFAMRNTEGSLCPQKADGHPGNNSSF